MIAALICGRADGPRFPSRNTFPLFGRPLMLYAALAAVHAAEVDHVFMTSDDEGMKRVAGHHGVRPIDRPEHLSGDGVPLEDVVRHGYAEVEAALGEPLEALVVLLANAPTVTSEQIDQGVRMLRADATLDAVVSASAHDEFHPSYALCITREGRLRRHAAATTTDRAEQVYFPDALLWVLRPVALHRATQDRSGWLVDVESGKVRPLLHEGYGDVDYPWQIPMVEEWLRRRGFDDATTPYDALPKPAAPAVPPSVAP